MAINLDEITARNFKKFYEAILPYLNNDQGTHDFLDLINKPQINGVTLTGNVSSDDLNLKSIQFEEIPEGNALNEGQIIQYIGETENGYINGRFYECIEDQENSTYIWIEKQVSKGKDNVQDLYYNPEDHLFYTEDTFENEIDPEDNVLYQDILTNNQYRWNGTSFVMTNAGSKIVELTKEQYDALTEEEKNNNTSYYVNDENISNFEISRCYTPVGTIIAVMGKAAPANYLICDGATYNISDYPVLTEYFEEQFGSINFFGGDGESTFAVPDLRGEFLRGTGTNSHANNGNGADVGVHQDATRHLYISSSSNNDMNAIKSSSSTVVDSWVGTAAYMWTGRGSSGSSTKSARYTSRPTNTSVLYCIATTDIYDVYDIENLMHQMEDRLNPIGSILTFMGNNIPQGYLSCDGTEYNIIDYPLLSSFIETEFGTINHFGGDGISTFAVPDLRGEFLRGTGTNSHEGEGSGADVGEHQEATEHVNLFVPNTQLYANANTNSSNAGTAYHTDAIHNLYYKRTYVNGGSASSSWSSSHYTSRPTNTSVLFCIKAEYISYITDYTLNEDITNIQNIITEDMAALEQEMED